MFTPPSIRNRYMSSQNMVVSDSLMSDNLLGLLITTEYFRVVMVFSILSLFAYYFSFIIKNIYFYFFYNKCWMCSLLVSISRLTKYLLFEKNIIHHIFKTLNYFTIFCLYIKLVKLILSPFRFNCRSREKVCFKISILLVFQWKIY